MIAALVRSQRKQFAALANAWLADGATSFAIWSGGICLAAWPEKSAADMTADRSTAGADLVALVRLDALTLGELRVGGLNSAGALRRLEAEAGLVAHLARLERDLNSMTSELIDTQDQLLAMYDLTQASRHYQTMDQIVKQLAFEAHRLVKIDGALLLANGLRGGLLGAHYPRQIVSDETINRCFEQLQRTRHDLLFDGHQDAHGGNEFHNLLLVPIQVGSAVVAALGLVNRVAGDFTAPQIKLARAVADHAGARIENVMLYEEKLQRARLQTEMELAQNVQRNLLPHHSPHVPGLDLFAKSRPASQVGGDFYDFIIRPERPFTFVMGDVSGKGMAAAMLMTMMRTVVRTKLGPVPTPTPETIVARSNEELYDDFTDLNMFVTIFIGQYEPATRRLLYANAGHSPVIYCPADGAARLLKADGTAVGILPTSFSENQSLYMRPGDLLVVATDGMNEARNAQDEMFGYDRLLNLVEAVADEPAQRIAENLYQAVSSFSAGQSQDDDQTLIVLKGTTT